MDTTTVLSMRSLTTLPMRAFLRLRSVVSVVSVVCIPICLLRTAPPEAARPGSGLRRRGSLLLVQHGQQPGHLAPALADLERVVELLHGVAEPQVEQLLTQLGDPRLDLVHAHLAYRGRLHVRHGVTPLPAP